MTNSTRQVSLIHQLSRTGGTVFAKVIGNNKNVILLSEVHPNKKGEDIRRQCLKNYQIIIPKRITSYVECIEFLLESREEKIIVRDLSHQDFLYRRAKLRIASAPILQDRFKLHRMSLARHPADQYLSMMSFKPIKRYMNYDLFCRGYVNYHDCIPSRGIIRYEDFVKSPERTLLMASELLNIPLSESPLEKFHSNKKVTGDKPENGSRGIHLREVTKMPRREGFDEVCRELRKNDQIVEVCHRLRYDI